MSGCIFYKFLIFIILIIRINAYTEWIDPYSMDDAHTIKINHKQECEHKQGTDVVLTHYKRMINLLLNTLIYDRQDTDYYKGVINVQLLSENYDFLKEFTKKDDIEVATLNRVDLIMSDLYKKSKIEAFSVAFNDWKEFFYFNLFNREISMIAFGLFVMFLSYKLLRAKLTLWTVFKYIVFLFFIIDFVFTWISLLHDKEIDQIADSIKYKEMPAHCNPDKATFWESIKFSFGYSQSDCREYHKVIYKNYFWNVSPLTVVATQFGVCIKTPAEYIGAALGTFTYSLFAHLPWGLNVILLPIMLIFVLILICICLSFTTKTSFGFNFMYLMQFNFGKSQHDMIGDTISGGNLTRLLDGFRPTIEDVKPKKSKKKIKNTSKSDLELKNENKKILETMSIEDVGTDSETVVNGNNKMKKIISIENVGTDSDEDYNKENIIDDFVDCDIINNKENIDNKVRNRKPQEFDKGECSTENVEMQTHYIKQL